MDWEVLGDTLMRVGVAAGLGGIVGAERQLHGQWADLRTYMTVAMGSAIFVVAGLGVAPAPWPDATRVVQGVAAGIGFIGAGTILKLRDSVQVKGLTTAASIWLAASVGTASGLAMYELAVAGTLISLLVLGVVRPLEKRFDRSKRAVDRHDPT